MKCVFTVSLLACMLCALSFSARADTLTLTVPSVTEETPAPEPVPTPTPKKRTGGIAAASYNPFTATLTPEATFVPLPASTPDALGRTPTPGPASATPFPSPEATLAPLPESVLMGTVKAETTLRAQPSAGGSRRGVLKPGESYRLWETNGDWYRIESGSVTGWAETAAFEVTETKLCEAEGLVLRASSLNIHSCRKNADMLTIADTIAFGNPDAVGLQEVSRYDKADWLAKLAAEADYPYYYFSKTANKKDGEYGIALMSRYPILRAETFKLEGYPGDEPRVLQYAALLTPQGVVHFFNTHLSAREMYIKSVNLASMVYYARLTGCDSLFMTGDFNCGPPRIREFWPEVRFSNVTVNTYGDGSVPKILDNVLYTGRIRVINTEYTALDTVTDHALITAELIYE